MIPLIYFGISAISGLVTYAIAKSGNPDKEGQKEETPDFSNVDNQDVSSEYKMDIPLRSEFENTGRQTTLSEFEDDQKI